MAEQYYPPQTMHPAEGRFDVAEDLEEEERNAYSAHHAKNAPQQGKAGQKLPKHTGAQAQSGQEQEVGQHYPPQTMHPAEGRFDVAESVEEEQQHAYSARHKRNAPSQREPGTTF